jgi:phthalate 4,5-dioxygenase
MHENWSGFSGIEQEDAVIAVSMGPVVDRPKEYLVAADQAVVYLRRRLLESVRRVEGDGDPIGVSIATRNCARWSTPSSTRQHVVRM